MKHILILSLVFTSTSACRMFMSDSKLSVSPEVQAEFKYDHLPVDVIRRFCSSDINVVYIGLGDAPDKFYFNKNGGFDAAQQKELLAASQKRDEDFFKQAEAQAKELEKALGGPGYCGQLKSSAGRVVRLLTILDGPGVGDSSVTLMQYSDGAAPLHSNYGLNKYQGLKLPEKSWILGSTGSSQDDARLELNVPRDFPQIVNQVLPAEGKDRPQQYFYIFKTHGSRVVSERIPSVGFAAGGFVDSTKIKKNAFLYDLHGPEGEIFSNLVMPQWKISKARVAQVSGGSRIDDVTTFPPRRPVSNPASSSNVANPASSSNTSGFDPVDGLVAGLDASSNTASLGKSSIVRVDGMNNDEVSMVQAAEKISDNSAKENVPDAFRMLGHAFSFNLPSDHGVWFERLPFGDAMPLTVVLDSCYGQSESLIANASWAPEVILTLFSEGPLYIKALDYGAFNATDYAFLSFVLYETDALNHALFANGIRGEVEERNNYRPKFDVNLQIEELNRVLKYDVGAAKLLISVNETLAASKYRVSEVTMPLLKSYPDFVSMRKKILERLSNLPSNDKEMSNQTYRQLTTEFLFPRS